jgi:hypothetical protein
MAKADADCWSSEEEELNFGGSMKIVGGTVGRSGSFLENN